MTREKYCHVCGSVLPNERTEKVKKDFFPKKKQKKKWFGKKIVKTSLIVALVVCGLVPVMVVPILKNVRCSNLVIIEVNDAPGDQTHDGLEVVFIAENGKVHIEQMVLYPLINEKHMGTYHITLDLENGETFTQKFLIDKIDTTLITEGFKLLLINGKQEHWISYSFT